VRLAVLGVFAALVAAACASAATQHAQRVQLALKPVLRGLDSPLYLTTAPGEPNNLYVVEQPGLIRVAVKGVIRARPFLDVRRLVKFGGEQGLLSVAFDPGYRTNHRFYVDYTDVHGDTRVVEYRSRGTAAPARVRQLLFVKQPYPNHNGGQLQFGPDGKLYVGMGDGGSGGDPQDRAQNLSNRLGKLLRIDVDARTPVVTIAAYGLRNPWRFSFDSAGNLYIGDVGQNDWEEIDYTPRSSPGIENYGWNAYEGLHAYKPDDLNSSGGPLVKPITEYSHGEGCSVTGGYVWKGRYYYGDFCSGKVWSLRVVDGKADDVRAEPIVVKHVSSWGLDARGNLYAVSLDGVVFRVTG
jgi:glucose/arabinose dehydrogenase